MRAVNRIPGIDDGKSDGTTHKAAGESPGALTDDLYAEATDTPCLILVLYIRVHELF
jgi:hypothetical protein